VTNPPLNGELIDRDTGEVISFNKQSDAIDARRERFKLLDASASVLRAFFGSNPPVKKNGLKKLHRTCDCNRVTISPTAQVLRSEEHKKAFYSGIAQCASVWTCPVCAAKINEKKANEMRIAASQREALDLEFSLLTFTAPHTAADTIESLVPKMSNALSGWWRGAPAKRFKEKYGIIGHIRSFEIRYGENGWHPHFHIIVVSKQKLPVTRRDTNLSRTPLPIEHQDADWSWCLERWKDMTTRAGLDCPNEYGMDIQGGEKAGEYITKFGSNGDVLKTASGDAVTWDMMDEVTKGNVKRGKKGSMSPWDLLRGIADTEDDDERHRLRVLFLFYARAMKGVSQIKWSRGLRQFFELEPDKSDEEIVAEQDDSAKLLCHITLSEWRYLIKSSNRATVLELAENGGSEAVARFLFTSLYCGDFDLFYATFLSRDGGTEVLGGYTVPS
ncbi:hypothetical protein, partial [Xenorhabdus bovienii]|uniref:hypothetical protein n=1 Tax=Xenorhabdus bovienii TaxID=40576 RepID=UPI0023B2B514